MALLMIPHTFLLLMASKSPSIDLLISYNHPDLDRTGIINTLFIDGGNRGLEMGGDPCSGPLDSKARTGKDTGYWSEFFPPQSAASMV